MPDKSLKKDLIVEEWIKKADDDELNAASILKHRDGTPSGVCFLSQQMTEKFLKAFLVQEKRKYPKTHSLLKLTELCAKTDKSFIKIKNKVIFLNAFYITVRYPCDYPEFHWKEAKQAFESAIKIKKFILLKIKKI